MNITNQKWDIKCPGQLKKLFPRKTGYYYKVGHDMAKMVLSILADAYNIPAPSIGKIPPGSNNYAMYDYETKTILLYPRNHLKSIFHEFYHHLDNMTGGKYNSDDRTGGTSSLAWTFAEKLWEKFTDKK